MQTTHLTAPITSDTPYGCNNAPRPTRASTYPAQKGWHIEHRHVGNTVVVLRLPIHVDIPVVMSLDCQYDKPDVDRRCTGCIHAPIDADFVETATAPAGPQDPHFIPLITDDAP